MPAEDKGPVTIQDDCDWNTGEITDWMNGDFGGKTLWLMLQILKFA